MAVAEAAPDSRFISGQPEEFIGDKACDSGSLDTEQMVGLVASHRRNRTKPETAPEG